MSSKAVSKIKGKNAAQWASHINTLWQKTAEGFIAIGQALIDARAELGPTKYGAMLDDLDFDDRKAQMLVRIAKNPLLTKPQHVTLLPASLTTLDTLGRLEQSHLAKAFKKGDVHPNMERSDAEELVAAAKPKPAKEEPKPTKVTRSRVAEDAEVVDTDDEEDDSPPPARAKQNTPPREAIDVALENFDSTLETMQYCCEQIETAIEDGAPLKKLPKELQRKLQNVNTLLSNWVRKYT